MVYRCDVAHCPNASNKTSEVRYHNLPSSQVISEEWLRIIDANGGLRKSRKTRNHDNTIVCSQHFEEHCVINSISGSRKRLSETALPSIFPVVAPHKKIKLDFGSCLFFKLI